MKQIGIWGPRGAGKTCYIAMLMKNSGKNYSVIANDTETKNYVKPLLLQMERAELPRPTTKTFKALNLTFSMENVSYPLIISDFGGELVEELEEKSPEEIDEITKTLSDNLKEFIKGASGIMLFLETEKINEELSPEKRVLRKMEVDALTITLKEISRRKTKVSRPIALVLSKWDRRGDVSKDFEYERKRAIEYLKTSNAYSKIYNEVLVNFENIEIFPITSFGKYVEKDGRSDILPQKPEPLFLEEPIFWIAKKADEVWFESANNLEKRILKELELPQNLLQEEILNTIQEEKSIKRIDKIISSFDKALSYWQQILQDELAFEESKETAKRHIRIFELILEQLQQKREKLKWKNISIKTSITIVTVLIIFLAGNFLREQTILSSTLQKINGLPVKSINKSELSNIVDAYRSSFKFFDFLLKGTNKVKNASELWEEKLYNQFVEEKEVLMPKIKALMDKKEYIEVMNLIDDFKKRWDIDDTELNAIMERCKSEIKKEKVLTLLEEVKILYKKGEYERALKIIEKFEEKYGQDPVISGWKAKTEDKIIRDKARRGWESILTEIVNMEPEEAVDRINEFLATNPPKDIEEEAKAKRDELLKKVKERKRREVLQVINSILSKIEAYKRSRRYQDAIDVVDEYKNQYEITDKEILMEEKLPNPKKLYTDIYTQWDKYLYNKFYNKLMNTNLSDLGLLEDVYNIALNYINAPISEEYALSRGDYVIYVKKWIEWYRKWQNGGTITISLAYVTISREIKDSSIGLTAPDPYLKGGISVGAQSSLISTEPKLNIYAFSPNWKKNLSWSFGESISFNITVYDYDKLSSDVIGTVNTQIDGFAPAKIANTTLRILKNGKCVGSIKVMCSGWEPPEIPLYR